MLDYKARPQSAVATHCDGITESHFDITLPDIPTGCGGGGLFQSPGIAGFVECAE